MVKRINCQTVFQFLFLVAMVLFFGCLCSPALADNEEYDGYLFQLNEQHEICYRLAAADTDIELVSAELNVYRADTIEEALAFAGADGIAVIEPNYRVTLLDDVLTTNDTYYDQQWNLDTIGLSAAWQENLDGTGVVVGIVDSGIYREHEDLRNITYAEGYSVAEDDEGETVPWDTDTSGHGTFIAGIIAAKVNNGLGIAGIAPGVTLMSLKAFGDKDDPVYTSSVIKVIDYGVQHGCNILNLSFGGEGSDPLLEQACQNAVDKGIIVIAAVGNSSSTVLNYPAAYDCVIGVASTDSSDEKSDFSEYNESVFVAAPGEGIISAGISTASSYRIGSGTSFSCPHVVAIAALLRQLDPTLDTAKFQELLKNNSRDAGETGYDVSYGYGIVDLPSLLTAMDYRLIERNGTVTIRGTRCIQGPALGFAACYDEAGRVLQLSTVTTQAVNDGLSISGAVVLAENAVCMRVFLLNYDALIPVNEVLEWSRNSA